MDFLLGQIVSRELQNQVDTEVKKIINKLKGDATAAIAKQIAERISGMVIR